MKGNKLEESQKLHFGEKQKKKGTNKDGPVGTWPEQRQKIEKVGKAVWRPYATSSAKRIKIR